MINFYLVVVSTLPRILFLLKQIFHLKKKKKDA